MRSKLVRTLVLVLLLCSVGVAQQPGAGGKVEKGPKQDRSLPQIKQMKPGTPERSQLDEILAEALNTNPDIRVAAAKLAEAEAKLGRARVQVTQKVVALYQEILSQRAIVDVAQKKYDRIASSGAETEKVEQAGVDLTLAKARLDDLETQMTGLLGRWANPAIEPQHSNTGEYRRSISELGSVSEMELRRQASIRGGAAPDRGRPVGPVAERTRRALQTPIKVDYKNMTFDQILKDLAKKVEGLSVRNLAGESNKTYSIRFEGAMPVSAILQALSDEYGCLLFVREYGILATDRRAAPPGAMTVEEFLRQ